MDITLHIISYYLHFFCWSVLESCDLQSGTHHVQWTVDSSHDVAPPCLTGTVHQAPAMHHGRVKIRIKIVITFSYYSFLILTIMGIFDSEVRIKSIILKLFRMFSIFCNQYFMNNIKIYIIFTDKNVFHCKKKQRKKFI